jgi:hypothetical protein
MLADRWVAHTFEKVLGQESPVQPIQPVQQHEIEINKAVDTSIAIECPLDFQRIGFRIPLTDSTLPTSHGPTLLALALESVQLSCNSIQLDEYRLEEGFMALDERLGALQTTYAKRDNVLTDIFKDKMLPEHCIALSDYDATSCTVYLPLLQKNQQGCTYNGYMGMRLFLKWRPKWSSMFPIHIVLDTCQTDRYTAIMSQALASRTSISQGLPPLELSPLADTAILQMSYSIFGKDGRISPDMAMGISVSVPKECGIPDHWKLDAKFYSDNRLPLFEWDGAQVLQVETENRLAFYLGVTHPDIMQTIAFNLASDVQLHAKWPNEAGLNLYYDNCYDPNGYSWIRIHNLNMLRTRGCLVCTYYS